MKANIKISNISEVEKTANKILEHVEAIRTLVAGSTWNLPSLSIEIEDEKTARKD